MQNSNYDFLFKIVIIGDSGVGKSCLLIKFCNGEFSESHMSTIGVDLKYKEVLVKNKNCKLGIWDTAGQEKFRSITRNFYIGADGVMVVFDITRKSSFTQVSSWMRDATTFSHPKIPMILVGAKSDKASNRVVSFQVAKDFAENHHMRYVETSSKTGVGVDDAFYLLTESILSNQAQNGGTKMQNQKVNLQEKEKQEECRC